MLPVNLKHVQVQTVSWCNRSCAFCPSQTFPIERTYMELDTYEKLISELAAMNFAGRFSPFLMNEPLLDKRLPDLVALTRKQLPDVSMVLLTNGDAITIDKCVALLRAGVNRLILSCYDDVEQVERMREFAREVCDLQPGVKNVTLWNRGFVTNATRQILVRDCTGYSVEALTNRAGNTPDATELPQPLKLSCTRPFDQLHVRYNGDVVLCGCDWKGEVVFGNIRQQSLDECWNGDLAQEYRRHLGNKDRALDLCSECDYRGTPLRDFRVSLKVKQAAGDAAHMVQTLLRPPRPATHPVPAMPSAQVIQLRRRGEAVQAAPAQRTSAKKVATG